MSDEEMGAAAPTTPPTAAELHAWLNELIDEGRRFSSHKKHVDQIHTAFAQGRFTIT